MSETVNLPPAAGDKPKSKVLGILGTAVALVLIVLWIIWIVVLWRHIDDDAHWANMLIIFHSIEAAAFAAVSALLGVQVKRAEGAEHAEKKAKTDLMREKKITDIGEDLSNKVLSEKGHQIPLVLGAEMLNFDKTRAEDTTSDELARHFLAARRAANRNV